jgi:hypothetical protein
MKRAISFVLLLALEQILFPQNLIVNPGFESWGKTTKPTGWSTAVNCLKDSSTIKTGNYSCRHSANTSTTKNIGQIVDVVPGKKYTLSFIYKTETTGTEHGCRIWCDWVDNEENNITDATAKLILQPSDYMKSNTWEQFSAEVIAPPGAYHFDLEVRTYQNSITYLDDFVFEESVATGYPEETLSEIIIYPNPARDYLIISNIQNMQYADTSSSGGSLF